MINDEKTKMGNGEIKIELLKIADMLMLIKEQEIFTAENNQLSNAIMIILNVKDSISLRI